MPKKRLILLLILSAFLSLPAAETLRPRFEVSPRQQDSPAYPFFVRCSVIEEFALFPCETGNVRFFRDARHLYVQVQLQDSELICEAEADGGRLDATGDCLMILLKEENSPFLREYLVSPAGKKSFFLYQGKKEIPQPHPLSPPFDVSLVLNGKLNDGERDQGWSATVKIPLREIQKEETQSGKDGKWLIQVQRVNFSRFIPKRDVSGSPQNHGDPYETALYAELIFPRQ